ncbi:MAG: CDP-alcohol phosphatidyltransferase family protein [Gammaproteobacteria bacterium]|nr:CDP-alcohol phosphatidyltransferase family protein [Gammaproteobacteria bacterium]
MASTLPGDESAAHRARTAIDAALRKRARFAVDWLAARGVRPDHVTIGGLVVVAAAAVLIAFGWLTLGGIVFLFGSALDGLDGELARHGGGERASAFGGVLDSTADRVGEGLTFAGLAAYFAGAGDTTAVVATVLAMTGANLTSYVRARAEAAGIACRDGLCTRLERVLILGIGTAVHLPEAAVYLLTLLTFVTVAQRLGTVRRGLREE